MGFTQAEKDVADVMIWLRCNHGREVSYADIAAGALGAPGVNLWHASGETAWQSVFHFHLHVVPRFEPTDLTPPWTEAEHPVESLKGLAEEIRAWR
ncbi:HIT family protein [Nonomuraea spiralis]|uniref:HIT family protein n=1 Tax=Nonomuraea TaxID=83681 RepID=UPI000F7AC48E|nr:HIT domain-containing protein [Nonomuraea sp. WAC 01424]RSN16224.1 hypothetical protein DMB42_02315 [Nonomuraea sp. WAC 01424]